MKTKSKIINEIKIEKFNPNDRVLIIKINADSINNNGVYGAVREWWHINEKLRNEVKQVVAVLNGVVVGVFGEIGNWQRDETSGRYSFTGKEIKYSIYLGKRIPDEYRKKASPILKTWKDE